MNIRGNVALRVRAGLPRGLKKALKPLYLRYLDAVDIVTGRRRSGLPPTRIMLPQYGRRDAAAFFEVGHLLVNDLIATCGLRPDHALLDVGCGAGRMGYAIADLLGQGGSYDGFDVDRASIDWASRHVAPLHPNIRFRLVDVFNRQYNPGGATRPQDFRFPYGDASFDVCFLHSVFTHMLPEDLRHYLTEVARVLRPGGAAHASFYLTDGETETFLAARPDLPLRFPFSFGSYRAINAEVPEFSVAYEESYVRAIYPTTGLKIQDPVHRGGWCGRPSSRHQDVVVARRARG